MKKLILALLALCFLVTTVWATSPHFIKSNVVIDRDGCLNASWKEAGLGDNELIIYELTATAMVTYQCLNRGGNCPQAANKTTIVQQVSGSVPLRSGKNGTISGTLKVCPPGPGDFDCPNGQNLELAAVSYSNIVLSDTTNNVVISFSRTLSLDNGVCP